MLSFEEKNNLWSGMGHLVSWKHTMKWSLGVRNLLSSTSVETINGIRSKGGNSPTREIQQNLTQNDGKFWREYCPSECSASVWSAQIFTLHLTHQPDPYHPRQNITLSKAVLWSWDKPWRSCYLEASWSHYFHRSEQTLP